MINTPTDALLANSIYKNKEIVAEQRLREREIRERNVIIPEPIDSSAKQAAEIKSFSINTSP